VKINKGRTGAAKGPESIRKQLANLPDNFSNKALIFDAGNIHCQNEALEQAQENIRKAVAEILSLNMKPILLGGGHEIALGHYNGLKYFLKKSSCNINTLGIINFDAHFDLRPTFEGASSGTMFYQIAENCEEDNTKFNYMCIGIQQTANTKSLFKKADELGVKYILEKHITENNLRKIENEIELFCKSVQYIYLTICADVFSSAFAPGVSSPQPFGMNPEIALRLIKYVIRTKKVLSFDIAEVSPRFDDDSQTAKLAAVIIYAYVNTILYPEK
ncbi:MAG: formimidoylglutamase, partial [Chlorobi bacterium]|nr:formimidoylglutamase [Chlorobiota bacterium]